MPLSIYILFAIFYFFTNEQRNVFGNANGSSVIATCLVVCVAALNLVSVISFLIYTIVKYSFFNAVALYIPALIFDLCLNGILNELFIDRDGLALVLSLIGIIVNLAIAIYIFVAVIF